MSRSLDEYVGRITPWQSEHPRFVETVTRGLAPHVDIAAVIERLPADFDVDDAIGAQLDVVGLWVGCTRVVRIPLAGVYFAWDDALRGWDRAVWKGPFETPFGRVLLDDDTFRRLIFAVILANHWDGTVPGAQAVFDTFFIDPDTRLFVQDNAQVPFPRAFFAFDATGQGWDESDWYQDGLTIPSAGRVDVSMTVCIAGKIPDAPGLALLGQGAIPLKPGGVRVDYAVTSVDETPLFGWDVDNEYVAGWDEGSWGVTPEYLLAQTDYTVPLPADRQITADRTGVSADAASITTSQTLL